MVSLGPTEKRRGRRPRLRPPSGSSQIRYLLRTKYLAQGPDSRRDSGRLVVTNAATGREEFLGERMSEWTTLTWSATPFHLVSQHRLSGRGDEPQRGQADGNGRIPQSQTEWLNWLLSGSLRGELPRSVVRKPLEQDIDTVVGIPREGRHVLSRWGNPDQRGEIGPLPEPVQPGV